MGAQDVAERQVQGYSPTRREALSLSTYARVYHWSTLLVHMSDLRLSRTHSASSTTKPKGSLMAKSPKSTLTSRPMRKEKTVLHTPLALPHPLPLPDLTVLSNSTTMAIYSATPRTLLSGITLAPRLRIRLLPTRHRRHHQDQMRTLTIWTSTLFLLLTKLRGRTRSL